ncbi:hypothetical protein [Croceibacterium salegens]|uniref:hypothetical protein n=1 Tax=Croceibacterium salegens TaxID=1737568 RepID=UPI0038B2AA9C
MRLRNGQTKRVVTLQQVKIATKPVRSAALCLLEHGERVSLQAIPADAALALLAPLDPGFDLIAEKIHCVHRALVDRGAWMLNDAHAVARYSDKALARVLKSKRSIWSLTRLMQRFPEDGPFERAMQVAELDYIASSRAAQTAIAENYVGLPV